MKTKFDLSGKNILVTGAGGAIGSDFCTYLAESGARVIAADLKLEAAEAAAKKAAGLGAEVLPLQLDVTDPDAVRKAFDDIEAKVGLINVLVNSAGLSIRNTILQNSFENYRKLMGVNIDSYYLMGKEFAGRLVDAGKPGTIINMASVLAFRVKVGSTPYAISKAAVAQLTRAFAMELGPHQIRVNAIAPGYILTDMCREYIESPDGQQFVQSSPLKRVGTPDDLRSALLFFASDADSSFVTGNILVVDGGMGL